MEDHKKVASKSKRINNEMLVKLRLGGPTEVEVTSLPDFNPNTQTKTKVHLTLTYHI